MEIQPDESDLIAAEGKAAYEGSRGYVLKNVGLNVGI